MIDPKKFIRDNHITMTATGGALEESDGWKHYAFTCTIRCDNKRMTIPYKMGTAHKGKKPELAEVLDSIASDVSGLEDGEISFEEWAANYGYDSDSRKAESIFHACEVEALQLRTLLGEKRMRQLIEEVERL